MDTFFCEYQKTELVKRTEEFVRESLKNSDSSHDWLHIERVVNTALKLSGSVALLREADSRGRETLWHFIDKEVVHLGALLHDICDWKYTQNGSEIAKNFLRSNSCDEKKIIKILKIIEGVSFKNEIENEKTDIFPELAVVQDADRLDAIGAIGIFRTSAFSGARNIPLYNKETDKIKSNKPKIATKEEYINKGENQTTVKHFYEKLLHLKSMMKTFDGKVEAEKRHNFMIKFLEQLGNEIDI